MDLLHGTHKLFKRDILIFSILIFILIITGAMIIFDNFDFIQIRTTIGLSKARAEKKADDAILAQQSSGIKKTEKLKFVKDEIIIKFKGISNEEMSRVIGDGINIQGENNTSIFISDLNVKYQAKRIEPVFKFFQDETEKIAETVSYAVKKAKTKFPVRSKRAGKDVQIPVLENIYKITLGNNADIHQAVEDYSNHPGVEYAQPNHIIETQMVPNDPYYHSSDSWGQKYEDLWGLKKIKTENAWNISLGENIIVAVVDTGVDYTHEDLVDNIWKNPNEIPGNRKDDDNNGFIDDIMGWNFVSRNNKVADDYGHGTHVAGIIAAEGNNKGIIGVAPLAKIMIVKGLDKTGSGTSEKLAQALVYAAINGADVINNSWGCSIFCPKNPVLEDAVRTAHDLGALTVFAAGNSGLFNIFISPQNMKDPKPLVVSASTQIDTAASFTNFGFNIDVAAPGGGTKETAEVYQPQRNILSLKSKKAKKDITDNSKLIVGKNYLRQAGTSMSAPYAAGVAALIINFHPEFSLEQIRHAIRQGSDDILSLGFDVYSGSGRLNAEKALTISQPLEVLITKLNESTLTGVKQIEIYGTADGPNILDWRLEVGKSNFQASMPPVWQHITSSSLSVRNNLFGIWDFGNIKTGLRVFRLTAQNTSGEVFEDYFLLDIKEKPQCSKEIEGIFLRACITTIYPNPANAGESVQFTGRGDIFEGKISKYEWKLDTIENGSLSNLKSFSSNSIPVGIHTIYFRAGTRTMWSDWISTELTIEP